jgi:uncharacterized protein
MKCPDCNSLLKPLDCKGVVIQECIGCSGKWFERDELQKVEAKEDDTVRWIDFEPFGKDTEKLSVVSQETTCPKCSKKMQSLKYMKSNVVIDKCPTCKGVWLEAGELAKIVNYLKDLVDAEPVEALAKDTFKEFIKIFTGHKNIVSEIKEFFAVCYLLELRIAVDHPQLAEASQMIFKVTPFR